MNSLFLQLGIESWKPVLTALLLPPVPWLALLLLGLAVTRSRRAAGRLIVATSAALVWLSACTGAADLLAPAILRLPPALTASRIAELRSHAKEPVAIIVLGGGVENWAPEYQDSSLHFLSLERLRYGVWLGRETGWPVGFSGGVGWGQPSLGDAAEATVAQRIATREFGRPLRWVEDRSRDTRENAINTVALLKAQGIRQILLVTHVWHMPRSLRNFENAAGDSIRIEAAPMGLARRTALPALRWIPSGEGLTNLRQVVREWIGRLAGA